MSKDLFEDKSEDLTTLDKEEINKIEQEEIKMQKKNSQHRTETMILNKSLLEKFNSDMPQHSSVEEKMFKSMANIAVIGSFSEN